MRLISARRGSSPLARGLHRFNWQGLPDSGIIPARAGFTDRAALKGLKIKDHPRSRGVYLFALLSADAAEGSSPLARGLLDPGDCVGVVPGDHPRSRGVYRDISWKNPLAAGSSPLARGLLKDTRAGLTRRRIIPARAGFTRRLVAPRSTHRDHPRSRGVYR